MNHEASDPSGARLLVVVWVGTLLILGAVVGFSVNHWRSTKIVRGGPGTEQNLAITRAEAINLAIAAFIQSRGRESAVREWHANPTDQDRYLLLAPFLAFAPTELRDYIPDGYEIELPAQIRTRLRKVELEGEDGVIFY